MHLGMDLLTPGGMPDALRLVDLLEQGGNTPSEEAEEWRRIQV